MSQKNKSYIPLHQRDISWLSFNERVLQEAEDQANPLYERIKFLAIFSANLDEFYRVRISNLRKFSVLKKELRPKEVEKPKAIVKEILKIIGKQQERVGYILKSHIYPELESNGIYLVKSNQFNKIQHEFSKQYFQKHIKPLIHIYDLDKNPPFLVDKGLYLLFVVKQSIKLVNIPSDQLPRFIEIPGKSKTFTYCFLDEIVRDNLHYLSELKSDKKHLCYAIKLSRDAELYLNEDDYDQEIIDQIKTNLPERKVGLPTRLLYDAHIKKEILQKIKRSFELNKSDLVRGGRYHNLNDFFTFPKPINNKALFYTPQPPLNHPKINANKDLLSYFSKNTEIICYPYQKFDAIITLLQQAAVSKMVQELYITLYRLSHTSKVAEALILACQHQKSVTVFIEAKARFDEANNIYWGEKLEAAGAKVIYSKPNLKVHSKIFLIIGDNFQISHIGTGNFNESNAKIYTDFSYLTPNKSIASDLGEVFKFLQQQTKLPEVNNIWLAPFYFRKNLEKAIQNEIDNKKAGKFAFIRLKLNALEDERVIYKLQEAAAEGVSVQLIVRGICRLKFPQKTTHNLEGISIVGRYLEHGRIFWFANGGNDRILITSADAMTRNLDRRIEVGVEITEPNIKQILTHYFLTQWKDNQKARILDDYLFNCYRLAKDDSINSQNVLYSFFENSLNKCISRET